MRSHKEQKQEGEEWCECRYSTVIIFFPYIMRSETTVESLKMDSLVLEGLELLNELFPGRSRVLLPLK